MKSIEKDILALGFVLMSRRKIDIDREELFKLYESYFNENDIEEKIDIYVKELIRKINKKMNKKE